MSTVDLEERDKFSRGKFGLLEEAVDGVAGLDHHARCGAGGNRAIECQAGSEEPGMAAGEEQGDAQTILGDVVAVRMRLALDQSV